MALHSYALTTVDRQKIYLGITTTAYDTILERMINSATDWIERKCDRRFQQTTYTNEVYDGTGSSRLLLKQFPVSEAESFTLQRRDSELNEDHWSTIESTFYHIKYSAGIIELINGSSGMFYSGDYFAKIPNHYRVTYTAGYNFDNSTTFVSDTAAADLEYATWKLVTAIYNSRTSGGNIQSERIGDYEVQFTMESNMDGEIKSILSAFRRYPT